MVSIGTKKIVFTTHEAKGLKLLLTWLAEAEIEQTLKNIPQDRRFIRLVVGKDPPDFLS